MGCVEHTMAGDKDGYASTQAHEFKATRNKLKLHRLVYCHAHNLDIADIDGKVIMHTCDNPRCINPEHLKLGTTKDNNADRVSKGRFCGAEAHKAKLTAEDVHFIRTHYVRRSRVWNTHTLARKYGVCHQTISSVLLNKQYKEQSSYAYL